jgi:hypothetical protein
MIIFSYNFYFNFLFFYPFIISKSNTNCLLSSYVNIKNIIIYHNIYYANILQYIILLNVETFSVPLFIVYYIFMNLSKTAAPTRSPQTLIVVLALSRNQSTPSKRPKPSAGIPTKENNINVIICPP